MFDGFEQRTVSTPDVDIFCRIGGSGPTLLLLHGYPQTSAMWHRVAPRLAQSFRVVCADLRGYGRSAKPPGGGDHSAYSKRAMADDMVAVMDELGHAAFFVGAHDRGARVGHRMALDHPDRVRALAVLDIAPTREMYREARDGFARDYWHWFFLIRPSPFPERLIGADPDYFLTTKLGAGSAGLTPFSEDALEEYRAAFRDPAAIHASCEDYRAAATIDIAHDDADGGKQVEAPMLALWGQHGAIERNFDCLALWGERVRQIEGHALPAGHYLAEEVPDAVVEALAKFFAR